MKSLFAFLLIVVATSLADELHAQNGETTATISSRVHEHAETTTLAKALDAAGLTVALFLPKHADALIALLPYYLIDSADHPSTVALTEVRNGGEVTTGKQFQGANGMIHLIDPVLLPADFDLKSLTGANQ